ncbi:uncharacterized protein FFC1_10112 [Fusarium fujikuroi]|nr:uncharacterized protein FFC1_10112 [Fusarium fujikuroi]
MRVAVQEDPLLLSWVLR